MSLRGRLLLAVGAVALIALLTADVATYAALKNFLYDRVDQSLAATQQPIRQNVGDGHGHAPGPLDIGRFAPGTYVEIRDSDGSIVVSAPARYVGGQEYTPAVPDQVDLGTNPSKYFTVDARESGGPQFRVRASTLPDGDQLLVAIPLDDTVATLNRLLTVEIAVTVAALVAAGAMGWWLVRVGLHPLREVEATAEAIADRRVSAEAQKLMKAFLKK